jgi:hypothetical protein
VTHIVPMAKLERMHRARLLRAAEALIAAGQVAEMAVRLAAQDLGEARANGVWADVYARAQHVQQQPAGAVVPGVGAGCAGGEG